MPPCILHKTKLIKPPKTSNKSVLQIQDYHNMERKKKNGTCFGVVHGPEILLEIKVGQEDSDPSPDLEPVLLVPGVEDGASDARYEEDRVRIRVRGLEVLDPFATEAREEKAVVQHLWWEGESSGGFCYDGGRLTHKTIYWEWMMVVRRQRWRWCFWLEDEKSDSCFIFMEEYSWCCRQWKKTDRWEVVDYDISRLYTIWRRGLTCPAFAR